MIEETKMTDNDIVYENPVARGNITCGGCGRPKGKGFGFCECGRPKRTLEDVNKYIAENYSEYKNFKDLIQAEMSNGASLTEVKALMNLSTTQYKRFKAESQEFNLSIKKGIRFSKAWWLRNGRENLKSKDFSYTGWYMNMKNRFNWRDKNETDITSGGQPLGIKLDA